MDKIVMWATNKNGQGFVEKIGEFDEIEDINVRCGMFSEDVVITFAWVDEKKQEE